MKKLILLILFILTCLTSCSKENTVEVGLINNEYNFNVSAKSYIVMDKITGRVLYGNNINKRILPASTTKILTCLTVINNFNIEEYIKITFDMINVEGSKIYLEEDDVISVRDLLYGLMLNSGNDASMALAIGLSGSIDNFVYLMNEECKRIGMYNSSFENPSGLDETTMNYVTAYDMALLMKDALRNEIFRKITSTKEYVAKLPTGRKLYFSNKHKLVKINDYVTGGKTGYTKKAGRTLITSYKKDAFEIIVCTFNCPNDWEIHDSLFNKTIKNYNQIKLVNPYDLYKKTNKVIFTNELLFPLGIYEKSENIISKLMSDNYYFIINYYKDNQLIGTTKILKDD